MISFRLHPSGILGMTLSEKDKEWALVHRETLLDSISFFEHNLMDTPEYTIGFSDAREKWVFRNQDKKEWAVSPLDVQNLLDSGIAFLHPADEYDSDLAKAWDSGVLSLGEVHEAAFSAVNDVINTVPCTIRVSVRNHVIKLLTAQGNGEELIRVGTGAKCTWRANK